MIDIGKVKYPDLDRILLLQPNPHILLGKEIFWQEKGKSPTRTEYHDKNEFVVFDVWSAKQGGFMSYIQAYQHAYHFDLPFVDLYGTCNVTSLESLLAFKDAMLEKCRETKREGVVGKVWDYTPFNAGEGAGLKRGIIFFKEKLDTPHIEKVPRVTEEGTIILPPLPDSEILGAVDKVLADIGLDRFRQIREAMPLVARYVSEECKKHNCTAPRNLHHYYQRRLADLVEAEI